MSSSIKLTNSSGKIVTITNPDTTSADVAVDLLNNAYTIATVDDFGTVPVGYTTVIVKDTDRGGIFVWSESGTVNGGTVFAGSSGYWIRQYSGAVNVKWFGAIGDGTTNDVTAITNAIASEKSVYVPKGYTFYIPTAIECPNNTNIFGEGTIKTNGNTAFSFLGTFINTSTVPTHKTGLIIEGLTFTSSTVSTAPFISIATSNKIQVKKNEANNQPLVNINTVNPVNVWDGTTDPNATAGVTSEAVLSKDIEIDSNNVYGGGTTSAGIALSYTLKAVVTNNYIENCGHGIQFWGGDSNTGRGGITANPRWVRGLIISNNHVVNVLGGGIWGSMAQDVIIEGNIVENCGDVGIDFEGCFDSVAEGNISRNCANACYASFFYNINVSFISNEGTQDGTKGTSMFNIWNVSQQTYPKIVLKNNVFRYLNTSDQNLGIISSSATAWLIIENNTLDNCIINAGANNAGYREVCKNKIYLTKAITNAFYAISVSGNNFSYCVVKGNEIKNISTQNASTIGINAYQYDFNSNVRTNIEDNYIAGMPIPIRTQGASGNGGIVMRFLLKNNSFDGTPIDGSADGRAQTRLLGNTTIEGLPYPSARPTSGRWEVGQIFYYSAPTASGKIGEVCVTAGTPGTWKAFGAIDA